MNYHSSNNGDDTKNHKTLVNVLCSVHKGVNVFHCNARSLSGNKLDYVRYVFEKSAVDILCISETWFASDIPDNVYSIDGLKLFRNDRATRRGGGVAIYCRNDINSRLLSKSDSSVDVEYINVEIFDNNIRFLISCVYNPHRQFSLEPFFTDLSVLFLGFNYHVVCGDFNVNLLNSDDHSALFLNSSASAGLTVVNTELPTRFANNALPSLLDLILVSDPFAVIKFDQISFISDHDLVFCSIDIPISRSTSTTSFTYYDFKSIDHSALLLELSAVNWTDCWSCVTVDDKLQWFMNVISNIFIMHVPLKTVSSVSCSCPWLTPYVLNSIKKRNILHSKWKNCPNDLNWLSFKKARNFANSAIIKAKKIYFSSKLSTSLSSKQLWQNIRNLRIMNRVSTTCTLSPNILNDYFVPIPNVSRTLYDLVAPHSCSIEKPFHFNVVCENEICHQISKISSGAVGVDGISIRFVKLILPFIIPTLTHIINHCFTTSMFPDLWKIASVCPVAKKLNAVAPEDFRPISILPALGKVCEKIMSEQITKYLNVSQLLSPYQSGFRVGHSCSTAILKILDDLREPYDSNQLSLLCLLDFSKAFDSVNHSLLCLKLRQLFHFSNESADLIGSYLTSRFQCVKVGEKISDFRTLDVGVPQGSIIGPLLFAMYVNDIFSVCEYASLHAYADDVQLYISGPTHDVNNVINKLNSDLQSVYDWANANHLQLNYVKSHVLPVSRKHVNIELSLPVAIGDNVLKQVSVVKNLGYFLNSRISCHDHLNNLICKMYSVLRILWKTAQYTPLTTRRHLVVQLIVPHIQYFSSVYCRLDADSQHRLVVAFNNVTRYVFGLRKFDHISSVSTSILGVGILSYINIKNLIFLHNLINSGSPKYLFEKLHALRSTRTCNFVVPRYYYLNTARFFFVDVIRLWNALPSALKRIKNKTTFKTHITSHYSSVG